jgi:hypothetical protein
MQRAHDCLHAWIHTGNAAVRTPDLTSVCCRRRPPDSPKFVVGLLTRLLFVVGLGAQIVVCPWTRLQFVVGPRTRRQFVDGSGSGKQ